MDNYELLLSKEAEDNIDEAITTLVSAAQDIANKSEQDFELIKEKKWYKRLWELVTFSIINLFQICIFADAQAHASVIIDMHRQTSDKYNISKNYQFSRWNIAQFLSVIFVHFANKKKCGTIRFRFLIHTVSYSPFFLYECPATKPSKRACVFASSYAPA